jgi:hypothetical protein
MRGIDFTTYYVPYVTQSSIDELWADGHRHAIIGMDSADTSVEVVRAFLDSGWTWDAYRVIYSNRPPEPDADDVREGVLKVFNQYQRPSDLPGYICPDIERRPAIPSQDFVMRFCNRLKEYEIAPGYQVSIADYTAFWVYQEAGWLDWTWCKDQGHKLWQGGSAHDPFAGWTWEDVIGYQTELNVTVSLGAVDYNDFRDRAVLLLPTGLAA